MIHRAMIITLRSFWSLLPAGPYHLIGTSVLSQRTSMCIVLRIATIFAALLQSATAVGTLEDVGYYYFSTGSTPPNPLGPCQGDCDSDSECEGNSMCFQNDAYDVPEGCIGTARKNWDYCYAPPGILTRLGTTPSNPPLAFCHGDCDYDSDCQDDLVCYQNENGAAIVPYGCKGSTTPNWDYCYALEGQLVFVGPEPISVFPLGRCQGDCDKDSECGSGLSCFFNSPGETKVPEGCSGTAVESSDYCYEPNQRCINSEPNEVAFDDSMLHAVVNTTASIEYFHTVESGQYISKEIICGTLGKDCFVNCSLVSSCLLSTISIKGEQSDTGRDVIISCTEQVACFGSTITANNLGENTAVSIICDARDACNGMRVNIDESNFNSLTVYCSDFAACSDVKINIDRDYNTTAELNITGKIHCVVENACRDIRIDSNSNSTTLMMWDWSENVVFDNGYGFNERIWCNNNRSILYRFGVNETKDSIRESISAKYESEHFPCDGLKVICGTESCTIRYHDLNQKHWQSLEETEMNASCVYLDVQKLQTIDCIGQCASSSPTSSPTAAPSEPTLSPTTPSASPTAAPSVPTQPPTDYPTNNPTIHPTADPTADPTAVPTADPTANPTTVPTDSPTIGPTSDPTADPTAHPTLNPTIYPTQHPSKDPTSEPTSEPTNNPTSTPSFSPSAAPTNFPTDYNDYDAYIELSYSLSNLTTENKMIIWQDTNSVVTSMIEILERGYVERTGAQLEYREFDLSIDSINGVDIFDSISTDASDSASKALYDALDIHDDWNIDGLTLDVTIKIQQTSASLVPSNSDQNFIKDMNGKFRSYFNNTAIYFDVVTDVDDMLIIEKDTESVQSSSTALTTTITILSMWISLFME